MAAGGVMEDVELGFEEAMLCLPSHVLHEAMCETKIKKNDSNYVYSRFRSKSPTQSFPQHSVSNSNRHQKARKSAQCHWASGGPGMQAFFLNSGQKSCGTGVFLPQCYGSDFQPSRKPACSLVLLPSRVVQALNLNVHDLGLQISPHKDAKNNNRSSDADLNSLNNKKGKNLSTKRYCVISHNENSSPEIFLPKEWTY